MAYPRPQLIQISGAVCTRVQRFPRPRRPFRLVSCTTGVHLMRHALLALFLFNLLAAGARAQTAGEFRGVWINRWDYRTTADVKRAFEEVSTLGVTDVFWQVRGQADAFYKSDLEPWGLELLRGLPAGTNDPGYDPLALAIAEAHARGLKIHAWFNVMPMWKDKVEPVNPAHIFNAHPNWRLFDSKGAPQALNEHYVIVNPIYPEVQ